MNKGILSCSLDDTAGLREMVLANNDLPLLIFVGEEAYTGEYGYNQGDVNRIAIENLTLFGDMWLNEDDYREKIAEQLEEDDKYTHLSDEAFDTMVDMKVKTTEFIKAIVVWIG